MSLPKLIKNSAKCLVCGDILISKSVHDFRGCQCGNLFVDGGLDYCRRGYKNADMIEDLSEYEPV